MPQQDKNYTRYLVVKVVINVQGDTDQNFDDHIDELAEQVEQNLDCVVQFEGMCEAGNDCTNGIEVPCKIVKTEVLAMLDAKPLGVL